ncbi:MAG: hypothetical protein ACR2RE_01325 [Geminicoccaceae bacterium]
MKHVFWEKFFDLQVYILTNFPDSNFSTRFFELFDSLQDRVTAIMDAAASAPLPVDRVWPHSLLEAALTLSQSMIT